MRFGFAAFLAPVIFASSLASAADLIFIDPGHGKLDKGVSAGESSESELVLDVAEKLQVELKTRGVDSALSRDAAKNPLPSQRAMAANASGARAFISLHLNQSPSPTVRGPRLFIPKSLPPIPKDQPKPWARAAAYRADEAKALGLELAKTLGQSEASRVNVQALNLAAFKGLALPGLVVELGFLSHAESRTRFLDAAYRLTIAQRLADGILAWLGPQVGTKP